MTTTHSATGRHRAERPRSLKRRAAVVVAGTSAAVLVGGTAFAYWAATGTGSGNAQAGTMSAPTVSAGTTTGSALYPGLTSNGTSTGGTLAMTASNPNPFPITVTVSQSGAATGCTAPAVTFSGGSFTLAANASDVTRTVPFSIAMGAGASNDCQGQTLTVPLTTSSQSN